MVSRPPVAEDAWLEADGRRIPLAPGRTVVVGRDPDADVAVDDERASWRHAAFTVVDGRVRVTDLGSSNGTTSDGALVPPEGLDVAGDARVLVGETRIAVRTSAGAASTRPDARGAGGAAGGARPVGGGAPAGPPRRIPFDGVVRIGRSPDNDLVLDEANVSRRHCEIVPGPHGTADGARVRDFGSANGTRVGRTRVRGSHALGPDDAVGVGPFRIQVEGAFLTIQDERAGMALVARGASARAKGRTILHPTSIQIAPGEFVALIGESGAGKSTLLKTLAAVRQPSGGAVELAGDPVALRTTDIGYVPQSETVHDELTLREALTYAAKLRLPADTKADEIAAAVGKAMADLHLVPHADTRIGSLSGGQRKRAGAAAELLGSPTMLLLDEPTSGLDPGLERSFMELLRRLADEGRGVVVVTHATRSLTLCDTVAIMGRGGHLRYLGPPAEALTTLGAEDYDDLYRALAEHADDPVPEAAEEAGHAPAKRIRATVARRDRPFLRQTLVLASRYARCFARDRRTLAIVLGQVPVIALAIATLYGSGLLERPQMQPNRASQYVFLLVTAAVWVGLITSCREVVKERAVLVREMAAGVRLDAYLAAKLLVLLPMGILQVALLTACTAPVQPLHEPLSAHLELGLILVLSTWAATGLGMVVSSIARNVDQSVSLVPLLLIPQLLYAGALVPVATMGAVTKVLSAFVFARWGFAGAGSAVDMQQRLVEDPRYVRTNQFGPDFFTAPLGATVLILLAFLAAAVLLCGVAIARGGTADE